MSAASNSTQIASDNNSTKNGSFGDHLPSLMDAVELAGDEQAIKAALRQFSARAGFEYYAYMTLKGPDRRALSNYPEAWQNRYATESYFTVDPVITTAKRLLEPFNWSVEELGKQGGQARRFAEEASEFGLRSGISIPISAGFGRMAMLTLATDRCEVKELSRREALEARTAVAFLHISLRKLPNHVLKAATIALSPREVTCVAWAADGKTKSETAAMIGITEKTVRFYLEEARKKLDAENVAHAVRIASQHDLI